MVEERPLSWQAEILMDEIKSVPRRENPDRQLLEVDLVVPIWGLAGRVNVSRGGAAKAERRICGAAQFLATHDDTLPR